MFFGFRAGLPPGEKTLLLRYVGMFTLNNSSNVHLSLFVSRFGMNWGVTLVGILFTPPLFFEDHSVPGTGDTVVSKTDLVRPSHSLESHGGRQGTPQRAVSTK